MQTETEISRQAHGGSMCAVHVFRAWIKSVHYSFLGTLQPCLELSRMECVKSLSGR